MVSANDLVIGFATVLAVAVGLGAIGNRAGQPLINRDNLPQDSIQNETVVSESPMVLPKEPPNIQGLIELRDKLDLQTNEAKRKLKQISKTVGSFPPLGRTTADILASGRSKAQALNIAQTHPKGNVIYSDLKTIAITSSFTNERRFLKEAIEVRKPLIQDLDLIIKGLSV